MANSLDKLLRMDTWVWLDCPDDDPRCRKDFFRCPEHYLQWHEQCRRCHEHHSYYRDCGSNNRECSSCCHERRSYCHKRRSYDQQCSCCQKQSSCCDAASPSYLASRSHDHGRHSYPRYRDDAEAWPPVTGCICVACKRKREFQEWGLPVFHDMIYFTRSAKKLSHTQEVWSSLTGQGSLLRPRRTRHYGLCFLEQYETDGPLRVIVRSEGLGMSWELFWSLVFGGLQKARSVLEWPLCERSWPVKKLPDELD